MALTQVKTTGIADDAVTEAKVANDAIGITEMKAGTDGHVITYDASGNPTTVGPGTDGQVLTSTGAGSPPAFEDAVSEGTQVKSTGESGGTKFLREDGDGTCSWQAVPAGTTINNQGDNRVITSTATTDTLNGEANLTYTGANFGINDSSPSYELVVKADDANQSEIQILAGGNGKESNLLFGAPDDDDVGAIKYDHNGDQLKVIVGGAEKFRVNSYGLCIGGTGEANALDDYEEGTFDNQNVLNGWGYLGNGSDANAAPTMTYNGGHYVKIGDMVYVHMRIKIGNYNSAQGTLVFGTMPFYADRGGTESLLEQHLGCWMNACASGGEDVYAHTYGSSKYYYGIGKRSSSGHSDFTGPNGGSGLDISINGWYRIE